MSELQQAAEVSLPLSGLLIGISVSESDDLATLGYTLDDLNRVIVRLSQSLLAAGARLMFGHDWRPDGVMAAVVGMAAKYQSVNAHEPVLIQNMVAWPDQPMLEDDLRSELLRRRLVSIQRLSLCGEQFAFFDNPTKRALALSQLRHQMACECDVRVCLGGRSGRVGKPLQGFFSGVAEEAYCAIVGSIPLYIGGFLGGASAQIIDYLNGHGRGKSDIFSVLEEKLESYQKASAAEPEDKIPLPIRDMSVVFVKQSIVQYSRCSPELWDLLANAADVEAFATFLTSALRTAPRKRRTKSNSSS